MLTSLDLTSQADESSDITIHAYKQRISSDSNNRLRKSSIIINLNMFRLSLLVSLIASVAAFAPAGRAIAKSSLQMASFDKVCHHNAIFHVQSALYHSN